MNRWLGTIAVLSFLLLGCRTPATRAVIHRPYSEVKTALVTFVKSHEQTNQAQARLDSGPVITLKTNAWDLNQYFSNAVIRFQYESNAPLWAPGNTPVFRITEIRNKPKPAFEITCHDLTRQNSLGFCWVAIEARPISVDRTQVRIRSYAAAGPSSSMNRFTRQEGYEAQTLTLLCDSMKLLTLRP